MKFKFKVTKSFIRDLLISNGFDVPSLQHIEIEHHPHSHLYNVCLSGMQSFVFNACSGYFAAQWYDDDFVKHSKYICTVKAV